MFQFVKWHNINAVTMPVSFPGSPSVKVGSFGRKNSRVPCDESSYRLDQVINCPKQNTDLDVGNTHPEYTYSLFSKKKEVVERLADKY